MSSIENPRADMSGAGPVEYRPAEPAPTTDMEALRARHERRLMSVPGVTFVGVGSGGLLVGVVDSEVAAQLPGDVEGVPIAVTVTGPVEALPTPGAGSGTR
jgi:hypothetical protein